MKNIRKAVRTFLIKDNRVVAIKYITKNSMDFYDVPGGKIEANETSTEAAIIEFKEETGMDVYNLKYIGNLIAEYPNKIFDFDIYITNEFDLNNIDEDSFINWHMRHCKIKHTSSKKLPKKLEILVKDLINQHRQYNVINNYPVEYIDKNSANLLIEYQNNFSLFKDFEFCATYTPVENVIGLATAESKWSDLSNEDKMSLIHEIGHMKASSYSLDEGNNTLIVKEGFYISKIQLEPVLLENGDTFYKFIRAPKRGENYIGRALEEIINDLDCSLAFSLFNGNYPKLGKRLNDLCDKKLTYDRYSGGIEEVYTGLQKIIDSRDLADELLENIGNSIYGYYPEESENRALQLIKKYELSKKK